AQAGHQGRQGRHRQALIPGGHNPATTPAGVSSLAMAPAVAAGPTDWRVPTGPQALERRGPGASPAVLVAPAVGVRECHGPADPPAGTG
ncbi:MAG: hypothetical protein ACK56F_15800, partial [bacterium]